MELKTEKKNSSNNALYLSSFCMRYRFAILHCTVVCLFAIDVSVWQ